MAEDDNPNRPDDQPEGQGGEEIPEQAYDGDDLDGPSASYLLYDYLKSDTGHEIAKQVLELIKGVKQATLDRNVEQDKNNAEHARQQSQLLHKHYGRVLILQAIVFILVIVATSVLTYFGKFESQVAVLFGTLVGYFFGRRTSSKDN